MPRLPKTEANSPMNLWEVRKCPKGFHKHGDYVQYDMTEVFIKRWVFSQKLACCDGPGGIVGSNYEIKGTLDMTIKDL